MIEPGDREVKRARPRACWQSNRTDTAIHLAFIADWDDEEPGAPILAVDDHFGHHQSDLGNTEERCRSRHKSEEHVSFLLDDEF